MITVAMIVIAIIRRTTILLEKELPLKSQNQYNDKISMKS